VTPTRVGEPKVMTGIHQAQFLAEFTVDQAVHAHKAGKPFFIHTTPVMPHWGTCIGPDPPNGYGQDDPHWEFQGRGLVDPATGQIVELPISPCPSHKHAHDFDGQENPHLDSWNVSATGVVPKAMQTVHLDAYDASRAFPRCTRSILTEIYLCHACSYHGTEYGNGRAGSVIRTVVGLHEIEDGNAWAGGAGGPGLAQSQRGRGRPR
jgi:hypothetical protein